MKIKCDLCGGELQMDVGGQTASCVDCGMKHSLERLREKLAEAEAKKPSASEKETIVEAEIFDSEWEPTEPETYDAEWDITYDTDEMSTRFLRFSAKMLAPPGADSTPWEKIEWDIYSFNNCEFSIDFRDDVLAKLFPAEYRLYHQEYAKAQKVSEQIDAIGIIMRKTAFDVALTPEQLERLDPLLEVFTNCEASAANPSQPVWEMELNYPNFDLKHKVLGSIGEGNEVLMKLKDLLLKIFTEHFRERYPWIYSIDLNH